MGMYRAYVDKRVTDEGGGEHSRIIDFEAPSEAVSFVYLENGGPVEVKDKHLPKIEKDEAIGQIVEIDPSQAHVV